MIIAHSRLTGTSLKQAIERTFNNVVIHCLVGAFAGIEAVTEHRPDLVIADSDTEDIDGLDYIPMLVERRIAPFILIISHHRRERTLLGLAKLNYTAWFDGAEGSIDELQLAFREATQGRRFVSESLRTICSKQEAGAASRLLTAREEFLFALFGAGADNNAVSNILGISPDTVSTFRSRVMAKLNIHHKGDLIHAAITRGYTRTTFRGFLFPGFAHQLPNVVGRDAHSFDGKARSDTDQPSAFAAIKP